MSTHEYSAWPKLNFWRLTSLTLKKKIKTVQIFEKCVFIIIYYFFVILIYIYFVSTFSIVIWNKFLTSKLIITQYIQIKITITFIQSIF